MAFDIFYPVIRQSLGTCMVGQMGQDSTYIWFTTREPGVQIKLWRMRKSDNALIKPDGTVGGPSNAYVQTENNGNYPPGLVVCEAAGYVLVATFAGVKRYLLTDMSYVDTIDGSYRYTGNQETGRAGFFGGYCWFGNYNPVGGNFAARIDPATGGVTRYSGLSYVPQDFATDGTYLYVLSRTDTIKADVDFSTLATYTGLGGYGLAYDSENGYLWCGGATFVAMRVRVSDGAFINADGSVGDSTTAKMTVGGRSLAYSIGCIQSQLFIGEYNTDNILRMNAAGNPTTQYQFLFGGNWRFLASNVGTWHLLWDPTSGTMYGATASSASIEGRIWSTRWETITAAPNLTDVTPGTGPHLSLTFDNPVGITGPTIGAASSGLGVTGVTAISTTQIDLACAIRPDAPEGDATSSTLVPPVGEADNLGPPVPTGIGATVI